MSGPTAFQTNAFQNNAFQIATGVTTTVFGPRVDTTLTNKMSGPPGKNFTRKQKNEIISGIYQEGLLAKNALKSMSELEIAERDLELAEQAYWNGMFKSKDDLSIPLRAAQERVEAIRTAEAKKKAMDDARAHWRNLVNKATRGR